MGSQSKGRSADGNPTSSSGAPGLRVYAVLGQDVGRQQAAAARIAGGEGQGPQSAGAWNVARMDGAQATGPQIGLALATPALFGGRRTVIVHDAAALSAAEWESLAQAVGRLPPPAPGAERPALILVAAALDRRRKAIATLLANAEVIDCNPPATSTRGASQRSRHPSALPGGIRAELAIQGRALGLTFRPEAAARLAELVGDDVGRLSNEVAKLAAYLGGKGEVDERTVTALVPQSGAVAHNAVFALVDAIAQQRTGEALSTLHRLLDAGENPLGLLAMIARQMRLIRAACARQGDAAALMADLQLSDFVVRKVAAQARRFPLEAAEAALEACLAADLKMKGGHEARGALEALVVRLAAIG